MKEAQKPQKKSPWTWIPSLYFGQGLPYVVVMTVAVIMYKRMGVSNTDIALYTSWLYLPWVIKPLWSPFVDLVKTKRWWIVSMQLLIGAALGSVAFLIPMPFYFQASLAALWLLAFSSATHDIAADGFYMHALNSSQQSFFVGIRSTFYRLSMITGQGMLIILAGSLETWTGLEPLKFSIESTTSKNEIVWQNQTLNIAETDEMTFVAFPEKAVLSTSHITTDSLKKLKDYSTKQNSLNGFIEHEVSTLEKNETDETFWTQHIANPLSSFIKANFGKKQKTTGTKDGLTGNATLVAIRLTKKPEPGENVVLNTSFAQGDKSISLINGERITFNEKNWDKPAHVLVQLDYKLTTVAKTEFKGISGNIKLAWSITFFVLAGFFILLFAYHRFVLPHPESDTSTESNSAKDIMREFGLTFKSFFQKPGVGVAISFLLLYRLGEAFLVKMASPFLLDAREVGGLGLTTGEVGVVYGTVGVTALTFGGIVGGIAASQKGLKFWLWPMALSITIPSAAFLFLAYYMPENFFLINAAVAFEQFGYGFGFTAYMIYMIYFSDGEHKTAHYAICTAFMAAGMMLPGMAAGWLQDIIGYTNFFVLVMICAIPTLAVIPFVKIDKAFGVKKKETE